MELTYYADLAVRLVNTEEPLRGSDVLTSVDAVRELFAAGHPSARRATEADVGRLRGVRARLRAVFAAAAEGDQVRAVDLLNGLLLEYPASPQISGHDLLDEAGRPRWHLHLAEHAGNATAAYAAVACMGLAFQLTELGVDRLGVCEAAPCRNAYIDTSTNRSKRYCSDRCATRANVAAYRARKRRERDGSGRTAERSQSSAERVHEG
ncbi:ABATE domain-containing protein [Streptomyces sp. YIM 98790]|uniref:CGNR zinc finger domain-containing protein n=1 Tax=Streptomyces sp. YIM 98790 TaxID=2689077 RepID=UPI00140AC9F6|nr:CGNR zinc finger domain-containing protein [Streptomyces sp. YIM 98790]